MDLSTRYNMVRVYLRLQYDGQNKYVYFNHIWDVVENRCIDTNPDMLGLSSQIITRDHLKKVTLKEPDGSFYGVIQDDCLLLSTKYILNYEYHTYLGNILDYIK